MPRRVTADGGTAVHEAGHAVAALRLGLPIRYVTMRPRDPDVVAHMQYGRWADNPLTRERDMIVCCAGLVAEDVFFGRDRRDRGYLVESAVSDLDSLMANALRIEAYGTRNAPSAANAYGLACWAWEEAVRLVYANWMEVAGVARVLYCAPRAVSGRQLRDAMNFGQPAPFIRQPNRTWRIRARRCDLTFWPSRHINLSAALRRSA